MRLILASGSKYRQDIFNNLGLKYEVIKSLVEENSNATDPEMYVKELSKQKADSVASQINENAIIIAADTALKPLALAGIEPDLSVIVDGKKDARYLSEESSSPTGPALPVS